MFLELSCWRVNTFKGTVARDPANVQNSRKIRLSALYFGLALYTFVYANGPEMLRIVRMHFFAFDILNWKHLAHAQSPLFEIVGSKACFLTI